MASAGCRAPIALGLHHGDPEFAFEDDPPFGGPDGLDFGRGVALGEDIGNHGLQWVGGNDNLDCQLPILSWPTHGPR